MLLCETLHASTLACQDQKSHGRGWYILAAVKMTVSELVKKAGKARMAKLSEEEKSELSRKGAKARWAKVSPEERSAFAKKIRKSARSRKSKKKVVN